MCPPRSRPLRQQARNGSFLFSSTDGHEIRAGRAGEMGMSEALHSFGIPVAGKDFGRFSTFTCP
jgi:hypothetical protein